MDPSIYQQIRNDSNLLYHLRHDPSWYRELSKNPMALSEMEKQAKLYQGRTIPQRVERISEQMQLLGMFLQMASTMKD
ncbi:YlbE-like family protein [Paraliobacillus salinarum]|uniref:YlbE-like family protein n=1 Tax=Paraliobacillus salinarum TaxID=1158996 RepID=UPI0015F63F67|nr:YlbE-like family protein [Paraliobacillus salinarum]